MSSVVSAETSTTPRTRASTALLGSGRSKAGCPSQLGSFGLMTKSMSVIKTSTRPRLKAALPTLVARAIATTQLKIEQRRIKEIDINPLLVSSKQIIALDARVVLHNPDVREDDLP